MDEYTSLEQYHLLRYEYMQQANILVGHISYASRLMLLDAAGFLWTYCAECAAELAGFREPRCHRCGAEQPWVDN